MTRTSISSVFVLGLIAISCGGGGDEATPATTEVALATTEVVTTEPITIEAPSTTEAPTTTAAPTTTTTAAPTTTEAPTEITDEERKLVAECVTAVWGVTGFDQAEATTAQEACNGNAAKLDAALGQGSGDALRTLLDTTARWIPGDISDSDYPIRILEQTVALRDEFYPENDAPITDETKSAIATCTNALGIVGVVRADISSFGDRTALDEAIAACETAYDAAQADAALDAPGVSIAGLVSLDLASINATLADAGSDAVVGNEITFESFDAMLVHRIDRLNFILPMI